MALFRTSSCTYCNELKGLINKCNNTDNQLTGLHKLWVNCDGLTAGSVMFDADGCVTLDDCSGVISYTTGCTNDSAVVDDGTKLNATSGDAAAVLKAFWWLLFLQLSIGLWFNKTLNFC